jgi:predicted ATPase/uncharacterized protein (DUF3820 family)
MKIPFGKYKNRDLAALSTDLSYAEWIIEQEWVEQKYPKLYESIKELLTTESKELADDALTAKKNMLISLALKDEKIEDFKKYPFSLPVVKNLERTLLHPNVTFIVGENGSGKSTLLEALAITQGFNPEGGTVNFNFATRPTHSKLHEYLRVAKTGKKVQNGFFFRAESFYNVSTAIEEIGVINSYGEKTLHELSHGEAFFSLIENRFGANGLYILDEPEAALSPNRQMSMLTFIHDLVKKGSQFVISTHSPILLSYPNTMIYEIGEDGLEKVSYEETNTFQTSKRFLNEYEKMLGVLLS